MGYTDPQKRKEYYHRKGKDTLYKWRQKSDKFKKSQREYKKRKRKEFGNLEWERIKSDPVKLAKHKESSKNYRIKNKDKLNKKKRDRVKRLDDTYVKQQIKKMRNPAVSDIKEKKKSIVLHRLIKTLNKIK